MYTNHLRKYRKERNLTLRDLSELTGVSTGYLCHLERGTRMNPSTEVLVKIAEALGRNVSEVFFE